ncbi:MAG: hypothetical protein QOG64_268 [Acidimicrobiaceae bacterium]|jgi:hypothetical protein|nr:hypothetical protein [Acidimicrobiaceae bacterium]
MRHVPWRRAAGAAPPAARPGATFALGGREPGRSQEGVPQEGRSPVLRPVRRGSPLLNQRLFFADAAGGLARCSATASRASVSDG